MRNNTSTAPFKTTRRDPKSSKPSSITTHIQNGNKKLPSPLNNNIPKTSTKTNTTIPIIRKQSSSSSSSISTKTKKTTNKRKDHNSNSNTLFIIFLIFIFIIIVIQIIFGNYHFSLHQQDNKPFHLRIHDIFHLKQSVVRSSSSSITSKDEGDLEDDDYNEDVEHPLIPNSEIVKISDLKKRKSNTRDSSDPAKNADINIDPDKEPIRKILERAGVEVTSDIYSQLPRYSDIVSMYGKEVKILGLETCPIFQKTIEGKKRTLAVAGMFNTGTNLLTQLLVTNCYIKDKVKAYGWDYHGIRIQVPWGKHSPSYFRHQHKARRGANGVDHEVVLPAVMIKDPYTWMGSLCRHHYAALWKHTNKHCPNLVANNDDSFVNNGQIIPAIVKYTPTNVTTHTSIAAIWNDWNNNYVHYTNTREDDTFPRLMIRFEDILFRTKETVTQVCNCAGGALYNEQKFKYITDSAKGSQIAHQGAQGLLQAILFYGNITNRKHGFTKEDLDYAAIALDKELMEIFSYSII